METVTVLGGLGYIGSHLVQLLLNNNYKVKILDGEFFGKKHAREMLNHFNCSFLRGDIRNSTSLAKILKNTDSIIHLAGLVGDPACSIDEDDTWLHNTLSTQLIVDVANYYKVKKMIFASSCSVYGASPENYILNEGSYLNPVSLYAKTKIVSEKIMFEKFKGRSNALRLATVFGLSQRMRFDLVVNLFTVKATKTGVIDVYGGTQYRPFVHCFDAARAFLNVLMYKGSNNINKEVFNICTENLSIKELGSITEKYIPGTKLNFVSVKEDERNYKVSSEKAKLILDYNPTISVVDGIVDMYKVLRKRFDDWETNDIYYNHLLDCESSKS